MLVHVFKMTSTAPRSAPQICPVLGRENAVESIRLLDLAFEESTSTFETGVALQRCPKSVPAHIFKKRCEVDLVNNTVVPILISSCNFQISATLCVP